jgi:uncharacterized membrane protein YvlD (DUF360 family)
MTAARHLARLLLRFIFVWVVDTLSLVVTAAIFPGISLGGIEAAERAPVAAAAALVLGVVNLLIRPIVLLLGLPFGFFATFGLGLLANAVALKIAAGLLPSFDVETWLAAFFGGLVFAIINTVLTGVTSLDDSDSFYQGLVERLAARSPFKATADEGRGLVMLEVDGLSYWHIQKAIAEGYMPTLKAMIDEDGYALSRTDCGLPSQTSACQAGIMYGDNFDIPAFRWLDKDLGRLMVSTKEATTLDERYARGNGLMRHGSSINNLLSGDAEKSLLTIANVKGGTKEEKKRRAEDVYLLMLNPYFLMRSLALFCGDVVRELWQGWQQRRQDVQPRLDRLHKGYPFLRAATTTLMRDIPANLVSLDILRGSPAIYSTYVGYDEVAHHSGPWTADAFGTLRQFDQVVARIRDLIERKAPRPYELILLSDHGQSFGPTFKMRYGTDLKGFIQSKLPHGTQVAQTSGGDDGVVSVGAMGEELANVQEQGVGGNVTKAVVDRVQDAAERTVAEQEAELNELVAAPNVTVCGSGNIAQVYFDLAPRKISRSELDAAYPGLVEALVAHEGVGFVVAYADDGTPIAHGKGGSRDLHRGLVTGNDPLLQYASEHSPVALRAEQVRRVADFPHAGDLIVNSPVYTDGTVAAMEELIGNHGGLGGEQTDAFLFHPGDMDVPPTKNSADVYHILNARRGLPPAPPKPKAAPLSGLDAWSPAVLGAGLSRVTTWLGLAVRAIFLDASAFRKIVEDDYMTGPALLIGVLTSLWVSFIRAGGVNPLDMAMRTLLWLTAIVMVFGAARLLGGTGSFTTTLRALGFAQAGYVLTLLGLYAPLAPVTRIIATLLFFFGAWIGGAQAHALKGWRSLVLPVVAILVTVVSFLVLSRLALGAEYTLQILLQELGVAPQ